jgi:hypothetical protein
LSTVVASLQHLRAIGKKGVFIASRFFVPSGTKNVFNPSYVTSWNTQIAPTLAQYSDVLPPEALIRCTPPVAAIASQINRWATIHHLRAFASKLVLRKITSSRRLISGFTL